MQENMLDEESKMMEWNKCFEYRAAKMRHYKNFDEIFKEWPYFTQLDNQFFVNIFNFAKL